jgi:glycosyltransferase involved in cell wall biosynthesis
MTLDDASRRHWFVNPVGMPEDLQRFLGPGRNFEKWGHFPVDSTGPDGTTLSVESRDTVLRYDRVLATSEWGCGVLQRSGRADADWLPHGVFTETFRCAGLPMKTCKDVAEWDKDQVVVGCVMSNQSRKDFPALFQCFHDLKAHYGNRFHGWLHTDTLIRYWNVYALATDYGVSDAVEITLDLSDCQLALRYSGCDCTVLPSAGEGFGYPIAESLACGTACIVPDYSAAQEIVPPDCRVRPMAYRVDTQHNCLRAVLHGSAFAKAAVGQIESKRQDWEYRSGELAASVSHLSWSSLKHLWTRWLLEGLK